jgi:Holliday junction DNA helicase RuvB
MTTARYNGITYDSAVEALAAAVVNGHASSEWYCTRCGRRWQLVRANGMVSLDCINCGAETTEESARGTLRYINERIEAAQAEERKAAERDRRERAARNAKAAKAAKAKSPPPKLDDVIGNPAAVMQIRTVLDAFIERKTAPEAPDWMALPHTLLCGPAGMGKTMLSRIVAKEIGAKMHLQMGQTLKNPGLVGELLLALEPGDVLFIDEIHGLKPQCQEALYLAMEDGILVPAARKGHAADKPVALPPFTIIGATTDEWALLPSLCRRFQYRIRLQRLTPAELAEAITGLAKRGKLEIEPEAANLIGHRALGTPGLAIVLLERCADTAIAQGGKPITREIVMLTCQIWEMDSFGLDRQARNYLAFLREAGGEPVRLNVLSAKMDSLSRRTVETKIEPDLVWLGLIEKLPNGRIITASGLEHLRKDM